MNAGDVPAWVAAVAACVGVVVNALIVLVALAPIRSATRERTARGRLVAASLVVPMRLVRELLGSAERNLTTLMAAGAMPKGKDIDQIVADLHDVVEKVPPLLACFDIREAAWLDGKIGERLAKTVGSANVGILGLSSLLAQLARARKTSFFEVRVDDVRANAVKPYAFLPAHFRSTADLMGEFTTYCERISLC